MAVTVERLKREINVAPEDYDLIEELLEQANLLIEDYIGDNVIPEPIVDLATIKVVNELWAQYATSFRQVQDYFSTEQSPVITSRDPMVPALMILRKWVLPW